MNVVKYSDYETKALEFEAPANQKKKTIANNSPPHLQWSKKPTNSTTFYRN